MVNDNIDRILEERLVLTQMVADVIDAQLAQGFYELDKATSFAPFDPQADNLEQEVHMLAHAYGRLGTFSLGVYFYDAMGKIIFTEPYDTRLVGTDHSTKLHIRQVIESSQRNISAPFVDPVTSAPAAALTIPIRNEQGQLMSMLSGLIDLSSSNIGRPIEQALKLGHTGHAELVDGQGRVLITTLPRQFLEPGDHHHWYQKMMAQKTTGTETVPDEHEGENEEMHVMAFAPLSLADWGVAMGGNTTETFATVVTLRNSIFLLSGLMLIVILAATLIGARRLMRPVKALTKSAKSIAEGELTSAIQVSEGGEIGVLGRSLEEMRLRLKEYIDSIRGWNVELERRVKERTKELEETTEEVTRLEAARQMDRLKSEFISSISHELRTPLGFITGYTTTLLRSDVSHSKETRQEFLQIIKEESEKLLELVENLLDTSRIQIGSFAVETMPMDIGELAQNVVKKVESITDQYSLLLSFDPKLPSILGDSRRLEQVLLNLLENAIKYSPQGSQITISGERKDDYIQVSITDEGQGIPQAELAKIFDAFYRVPVHDDQEARGAGLGLTICKAIVEAHGGSIWAESTLGGGSIFYFTLPLQEGV
jgi:signal transduction histidine kinase